MTNQNRSYWSVQGWNPTPHYNPEDQNTSLVMDPQTGHIAPYHATTLTPFVQPKTIEAPDTAKLLGTFAGIDLVTKGEITDAGKSYIASATAAGNPLPEQLKPFGPKTKPRIKLGVLPAEVTGRQVGKNARTVA